MPRKKINPDIESRIPVFLQMVGDTFQFLRLDKGVSIRQVAKSLHMAPATIRGIEEGSNQGMRYQTFERLCEYYGTNAREFFSGSGFSYRSSIEGKEDNT